MRIAAAIGLLILAMVGATTTSTTAARSEILMPMDAQ
jgi:hypothetical protein